MLTRYTQKNLTWIDLVAPTAEEVRGLMKEFGFNPLVGQELLSVSFKSKVERFDDSTFAVLHFPASLKAKLERPTHEIDFIIGKNYLITTRYENITPLGGFAKAFEVEAVLGREGQHVHGGHLFAAVMRNLYRALVLDTDSLKQKLETIEDHIFDGNEKKLVIDISLVGREIYDFSQALSPHKEVLSTLEAPIARLFGQEFSFYMRGISAEFERLQNAVENLRESMSELRETNNSMLNAKQNEVMKVFSVLAFVFVPVSLIMTLFQMGLPGTPFLNGGINFWEALAAMLLISFIFFYYFKKKGWL